MRVPRKARAWDYSSSGTSNARGKLLHIVIAWISRPSASW